MEDDSKTGISTWDIVKSNIPGRKYGSETG